MRTLPKGVGKIVRAALGTRNGNQLLSQVNKWLRCSGPEWTVNRLKALRTGAMHLRAGDKDKAVTLWQQHSISYNHGTGIPSGAYHSLFMDYVHATNLQPLKRLDAVFRLYTSIRNTKLTHAQLNKAKSAITDPFTGGIELTHSIEKLVESLTRKYLGNQEIHHVVDLSRLRAFGNTHSEHTGDQSISNMPWGKLVRSLWTSCYLPESVRHLNPAPLMRDYLIKSGADSEIAGHISFIQEGGCKARVVAVPNVWVQGLFQTLHVTLDTIARQLPASCMHDQNKGAQFLRTALEEGKQVYCFDLSSATDRFPRSVEAAFLRGIGLPEWATAFDELSSAPWKVSIKVDSERTEEVWSYTVGQPMGTYGSFPLFHLTHYMCVLTAAVLAKVNLSIAVDSFRVLGDDIIITNPDIAKYYTKLLKALGVNVSPSKTIISDRIGEFAGFVCHKTTRGTYVYRPYKYGRDGKWTSPLNLMFALGRKTKQLGKYWEKRYREFCYTYSWRNPDLSPIPLEDKPLEARPPGLNSHLLGSMSNRFSYCLTFEPSIDLLEVYEDQQILLLGQKERRTPSGFASANLNPLGILIPEEDEECDARVSAQARIYRDPLMREASTGELRDKGKTIKLDL